MQKKQELHDHLIKTKLIIKLKHVYKSYKYANFFLYILYNEISFIIISKKLRMGINESKLNGLKQLANFWHRTTQKYINI